MASKTNKLSTNNLIALAALVVFVALIILIVIGRTLVGKIILNGKVISKKLTAQHQLNSNIAALPGLASNYQGLGSLQGVIDSSMPTTPDFPSLVALMEAISGASGVTLNSVSPGTTAASTSTVATATPTVATAGSTDAAQQYPLTISVSGNYQSVLKLLGNLQLSSRPLKVVSVNTSGTTPTLTATFGLVSYYYNPTVLQTKTEVVK